MLLSFVNNIFFLNSVLLLFLSFFVDQHKRSERNDTSDTKQSECKANVGRASGSVNNKKREIQGILSLCHHRKSERGKGGERRREGGGGKKRREVVVVEGGEGGGAIIVEGIKKEQE